MRRRIAKGLLIWGGSIFVLVYLAGAIVAAADAFVKSGWGGLAAAIVLASAVPALVLGALWHD